MIQLEPSKIDELEECVDRVVSSIEKTISVLKNVEAFSPINRKRPPLDQVDLVSILEAQGIFQHVEETINFVEEKLCIETGITVLNVEDIEKDQRSNLIRKVLLPLLESLSTCYRLLDSIPQPPPPQRPHNKKKKKPPPPRGMLSIQNYTDVAVLLEFTVCTSLLPCLDANVLTSIQDRAQYSLPKSLAGRLSRFSMLWGTAVIGERDDKLRALEVKRTVATISNVVLLDRFRPMLLPRHLADLYAGLFQAEALEGSTRRDADVDAVYSRLMPVSQGASSADAVDSFSQARSLQTLLLRGTRAPLWLRKRVSNLLTDLATRDLFAIVQVFVISASSSQEDMTGATLRLVTALVTIDDDDYYSQICLQLVQLLDVNVERMDAAKFAAALTVWAFLDQLPRHRLARDFLPVLAKGMFTTEPSISLHRMVRRIIALFSVIPASHNATSACELVLYPIPTNKAMTMFSQLVRIASLTTIEDINIKSDAIVALRMFSSVMERTNFNFKGAKVAGSDLLSISFLYAITPSRWDIEGYRYQIALDGESKETRNLTLLVTNQRHVDEACVLSDVEKRATVIVEEVIGFLGDNQDSATELKNKSNMPRSFFQHLLVTIFAISQEQDMPSYSPNLRLAVMIVLPLLCERCPPETLLLGTSADASGILATFKLILDCTAASVEDTFLQSQATNKSEILLGFDKARQLFLNIVVQEQHDRTHGQEEMHQELEETLMSTASIALSLLTVMLELGSEQRNPQELALLEATVPSLRVLSSFVSKSKRQGVEADQLQAEMAEMASHAAALIVSRNAESERELGADQSNHKSVSMLITEAENEISSDHPAVRAQGVVRLRRLARGYLAERGEQLPSKPMIVEVTVPLSGRSNDEVLNEILRVSMLTLADSESYVYLAGIQTIVAIADVCPQVIIPKIGLGVCTGKFHLNAGSQKDVVLTQDERIKLSEALLFIVRRRGAAINHYVPQLLDMMIYGNQQVAEEETLVNAKIIQEQTHDYFISDAEGTNELTTPSDRLDAKTLRVNTGGPIFKSELNDVLRSSCIAVVAEIVNVTLPSSGAPYAIEMVQLVSNIMHLEVSRPVRRAAVFLAVALYDAVLRELEEPSQVRSLTVALVHAKEEAMKSALEACIDQVGAAASSQLYDPATSARCQEALDARNQVEETGAFVAAALHLEVQKREGENQIVSIVKRRLDEGGEDKTQSLVMQELRIDQ